MISQRFSKCPVWTGSMWRTMTDGSTRSLHHTFLRDWVQIKLESHGIVCLLSCLFPKEHSTCQKWLCVLGKLISYDCMNSFSLLRIKRFRPFSLKVLPRWGSLQKRFWDWDFMWEISWGALWRTGCVGDLFWKRQSPVRDVCWKHGWKWRRLLLSLIFIHPSFILLSFIQQACPWSFSSEVFWKIPCSEFTSSWTTDTG